MLTILFVSEHHPKASYMLGKECTSGSGVPHFSKGEPSAPHFTIKWRGVKVSVKVRWGLFSPLRVKARLDSGDFCSAGTDFTPQSPILSLPHVREPHCPLLSAPSHQMKIVLCPNFPWKPLQKGTMLKTDQSCFPPGWERLLGLRTGSSPEVASTEGSGWVKNARL